MRKQLVLIFWIKWREEREDMFFSCLLDVHNLLLYAVFRIWKRRECSGGKRADRWRTARHVFGRKFKKRNKSWKSRRQEWTGRATLVIISKNRWQFKSNWKIVFACLMLTATEVAFFDLFYPSLSHLQGKQALYFHNLSFPHFLRHFGQFGVENLLCL